MFERFTDRARQVVVLGQEEPRTLGHGYVGTEHLLLGLLLAEEGLAGEVLRTWGLSIEAVRAQVERLVDSPGKRARGEIPLTPRAKKSLLTASRLEAGLLGEEAIDTEHLLLALLREEEGMALRVLGGAGARAAGNTASRRQTPCSRRSDCRMHCSTGPGRPRQTSPRRSTNASIVPPTAATS
jgi:ATP-dependent Clp protease ATP-binding subunit ClpC